MTINVAGKLSKLINRKCPSCKGPLGDTSKGWSVCEVCKTKACVVCGKISIHGARLSTSGKPLCPKHYSAFVRMKEGAPNLKWQSDMDLANWIKSFSLEATQEMEKQLIVSDDIVESIIKGVEISDDARRAMLDALTDEQKAFIQGMIADSDDSDE
jgi:predicted amidophosphoribosyltransferase